ncbi:hypothetical protein LguiA_007663 [Lonicera macranthoides]
MQRNAIHTQVHADSHWDSHPIHRKLSIRLTGPVPKRPMEYSQLILISPENHWCKTFSSQTIASYGSSCYDGFASRSQLAHDIDCTSSNPPENMPEALRSRNIAVFDKLSENFREPGNSNCAPVAKPADNVNLQQSAYGQPYSVANNHAREADIWAISELARSLDKKESILRELKQANDDLFKMQNEGDSSLKDSETIKKQHAMVSSAWLNLGQLKEGEDAFLRIGVALDSLGRQKPTPDSGSTRQHQLTSTSPKLSLIGGASVPIFHHDSDLSEAQIPSELITSCVATWLMIQMCTERQYPPSEVAQILDSAVRSLQPSCPQNLGVYREIQMSMGRIKTQILALVPTQN